jgi:hypothetical protein
VLKEQIKGFEDLKEVPMSTNLCSYSDTYFSFCRHLEPGSDHEYWKKIVRSITRKLRR